MVTTITAIGVSAVGVVADVSPNSTGLPGISTLCNMVGALLTIGLIACVAGLVSPPSSGPSARTAPTRTWRAEASPAFWWPLSPPC